MKKRLEKMLKAKEEQRNALNKSMIESESKEERAAIGETLAALEKEIADVREMIAEADEPADEGTTEGRSMNVVATMSTRSAEASKEDKFDSEAYRTAFMNYVCRGTAIPSEYRADATTTTGDASAVIPTTILKEMVKELKTYGNLFNRIRALNVQGGVEIPILSLKPVATWISANTGTSESGKQKITANTKVVFNYYGLECKVAQTLLTNVTTLEMFQQLFVPLAVEAIAKAMDTAIVAGSGSGEPLGITKDTRVPATQIVTLSNADVGKWNAWKKNVIAKIPAAYRNGAFIMAQATFDGYVDGMVDTNGQPIGRVNYGITDGESYRFAGKEVVIVETDIIKDWDSASADDVVAIFCNLKDYAINTNMQMQTVKWVDHDTNEVKNKVILIADGKLVDPNGVVIVKKGS